MYLGKYIFGRWRNVTSWSFSGTRSVFLSKSYRGVYGWEGRNDYKFKTNQTYTGIPYSQTAYQVDDTDFRYALNNNSSFYDRYIRFNRIMPKYGNDCSGFLSFAWDATRHTTNDFITGIRNGKFKKIGNYDAFI